MRPNRIPGNFEVVQVPWTILVKQSTSFPRVIDGQGVESPDPVRVAALELMIRVRDSRKNNVDNDSSTDSHVSDCE